MSNDSYTRKLSLAAASAVALLAGSGMAQAQTVEPISAESPRVRFDIPAQPLSQALIEYSRQARVAVAASSDVVAGRRSAAVSGEMSAPAALERLVEGTGLQVGRGPGGGLTLIQEQTTSPTRLGAATNTASSEEEIVVTAQKREERALDVPISIDAIGSEELAERQISSVDDLPQATPGLFVQSNGSYGRIITLRGLGNTFGTASLIGLYVDEAAATAFPAFAQPDIRAYDLERVEILRGPQGTLYGEGSVGGTLRFITRQPDLASFDANADVEAAFTVDGAPSQRIVSSLNIPIVSDQLGVRVAGEFAHDGGWIDQPAANREDFNESNLTDVRVSTRWQPIGRCSANLMAIVHRNEAPISLGENSGGDFIQTFNLTTTPHGRLDYELYNATFRIDLDWAELLSTTTYLDQRRENRELGRRFQFTAPPDPRFDAYYPLYTVDNQALTQEIRLTSEGDGPLEWTIGAWYRDADYQTDIPQLYFDIPGPPGSPLPAPFTNIVQDASSEAWAAFADASVALTTRLRVGAGVRYFEDEQRDLIGNQQTTFSTTNPRIYAQYNVSGSLNIYASAAEGFRSGGFNFSGAPEYDPESVWTYELGTKFSTDDRRLRADVAIFFSDYSDYQIVGVVPTSSGPTNLTSNAGDAELRGIELDLDYRPSPDWEFSLNGTYVDSEFTEINATSSTHAVGDPLDISYPYTYTLSAQRNFDWLGRPAFARVDFNRRGSAPYRGRNFGTFYYSESDTIETLNVNLGLDWSNNLSLGLFGRNLLNDRGYTDPYSIEETAARAQPMTVGVRLSMHAD